MKSKEYINKILFVLHDEFPSFTFKYQFDGLDDSHVIEYSPFDLIEGDIDFENRKYDIIDNYFNNDFSESLVFINEFDPVGISNPEILFEGHFNYSPKNNDPQIIQPNSLGCKDGFFAGEVNFALAA